MSLVRGHITFQLYIFVLENYLSGLFVDNSILIVVGHLRKQDKSFHIVSKFVFSYENPISIKEYK